MARRPTFPTFSNILTLVLALAAWPSWVEVEAGTVPPNRDDRAALASFKWIDRQGDLRLTPDELAVPGANSRLFAILDRDNDGVLTAADGAPARRLLHQLGTQRISRNRFATLSAPQILAALDQDGDGRLSMAELRPSLAGNAPLEATAPPSRPDIVEQPARPQPCWILDGNGRWIPLPASTPTCKMR